MGRRLLVQAQNSRFPLFDRNPQTFTNIYRARAQEYRQATQKVYRSTAAPSHLVLSVISSEVPIFPSVAH